MDSPLAGTQFHFVDSIEKAMEFMRWLGERRPILAVDTETSGLDTRRCDLRLVQFGDAMSGWAIPWHDWAGVVKQALRVYEGDLVAHNLAYDARVLMSNGVTLERGRCHDTMLMSHIDDPRAMVGLKPMSARLIDSRAAYASRALDEAMTKNKWGWGDIPIDFPLYWAYGALDAVLTARAHEVFTERFTPEAWSTYELERQVLWVLVGMQERGCRIDVPYTELAMQQLEEYAVGLEKWAKEMYRLNIGSPKQLAETLVAQGVDLTMRTPAGQLATTAPILRRIDHPLADAALRQRRARKLVGSYLSNFLEMRDGDTLRPNIRQLGARTGRMSITDPALQTLPRGHIVRNAFIPSEGEKLYTLDYDQVEMRVLCHFARDENMRQAILDGDLHTTTARLVYSDPTIDKKDKRRQTAKNAGFAIIYGAGVEKFALTAGITVEEAKAFLDGYHATYPGVKAFQNQVANVVGKRKHDGNVGWVRSPVGRWHPATDGKEYALVNYLVQGTACDILKEALVRLDDAGMGEYMLLPVHDEIIMSVPDEGADEIIAEARAAMTDNRWIVPISVDVEGPLERWGEKYKQSEFEWATDAESIQELAKDDE